MIKLPLYTKTTFLINIMAIRIRLRTGIKINKNDKTPLDLGLNPPLTIQL